MSEWKGVIDLLKLENMEEERPLIKKANEYNKVSLMLRCLRGLKENAVESKKEKNINEQKEKIKSKIRGIISEKIEINFDDFLWFLPINKYFVIELYNELMYVKKEKEHKWMKNKNKKWNESLEEKVLKVIDNSWMNKKLRIDKVINKLNMVFGYWNQIEIDICFLIRMRVDVILELNKNKVFN